MSFDCMLEATTRGGLRCLGRWGGGASEVDHAVVRWDWILLSTDALLSIYNKLKRTCKTNGVFAWSQISATAAVR